MSPEWHAGYFEDAESFRFIRRQPARIFEHHTQPIRDEAAIRLGHDELQFGIHAHERRQRLLVEMVRVIVTRRDDINEVEALRRDHALGHSHVRLVGLGIFVRERIGEVRVEQQVTALPLGEKPALAEPPEVKIIRVIPRGQTIGEEVVILQCGLNHGYRE